MKYTYKATIDNVIDIDFNKIKEFINTEYPSTKNHFIKTYYSFLNKSVEILKELYGLTIDESLGDNDDLICELIDGFYNFLHESSKDYTFLHISEGELTINFDDIYSELKEKYPETYRKQFLDNISSYIQEFSEENLNYEYNTSTLNRIALDWITYCDGKE